MIARAFACLIACLLLTTPTEAQISLHWQLPPGRVFEVERHATQMQTVAGKTEVKQERQSTWHIRLEVRGGEPAEIQAVLTKIEQKLTGVPAHDMLDPKLAEKMQGSSFSLLVTPDGKLARMYGYEKLLDRLADNDQKRLNAVRVLLPEESLKEIFADIFVPLPESRVARGDTWQRSFIEPIPHFGALHASARYVYEGNDRITYTLQTRYAPPSEEKVGLFRVVKGAIRAEKATGTITFDNAAGHLVEHQRSMSLRGNLTIESMDRQHALEFTSDNDVKIRVKLVK